MDRKYVQVAKTCRLQRASVLGLTLLVSSISASLAANNQTPTTLVAPPPPVVTNYTYGPKGIPRATSDTPAPPPHAAPARKDEDAVVQTGKPVTASALNQWQAFNAVISIKPGTDVGALSLKFTNGDGGPPFQDVRIYVNRKPFATIGNFANGKLYKPAGSLQSGNNALVVQGLGPVGAQLTWKLIESSLQVTSVNPTAFELNQKVAVIGKGFPTGSGAAKVTIGGIFVPVANATPTNLTLRQPLPDSLKGGKQDLIVIVGSKKSAPIRVNVKIAPELSSVDYVATAPGQPVTISGKNFSAVASENVVTIGGETCQVNSASPTSLSVTVPLSVGNGLPVWNAPIKVTTNEVESKGDVFINIGQRVIENNGTPQQ